RQIEMLNVLAGFEQSNKCTISDVDGEPLGHIAEDPKGLLGTLARQALRTHRPFRAVVTDINGKPLLDVRIIIYIFNREMFVQRMKDHSGMIPKAEPQLETFGEVQQEWHLWRRRYNLFLRELVVSGVAGNASGVDETESKFYQVARVDAGFLAWQFALHDANGDEIASMVRAFRGFGHEIFLDTGRYSVNFAPRELVDNRPLQDVPATRQATVARTLSLDERAVSISKRKHPETDDRTSPTLHSSSSLNIDFDYFSRHSHVGG
ncbi:Scramblase, partial [Crepidotus variabilis]